MDLNPYFSYALQCFLIMYKEVILDVCFIVLRAYRASEQF